MIEQSTLPEPPKARKGLAWTSLVLGIAGLITCISGIAGLITGVVALKRARRDPEGYGGAGLAKAGIVLSSISLLLIPLSPLIVIFLVQPVKYEGTSMMPALNNGDRIFLGKQIESIDRGDIVAFWFPDDPSKTFVKRVVGLPGETIRIDFKGAVYINGNQIEEPYVSPDHSRFPRAVPDVVVKAHYYFVMGDNRDQSNDSRSWGLVPEKYIYGKFLGRYYSAGK